MTPQHILAFVAIIFVDVFGFGYATTRQPAAEVANVQTFTNDQASVQTATTQTRSDDDEDDDDRGGTSQPTQPTTQPTTGTTQTSTYTMAQVKTHNSTKSCWAVVSGKVYDLTAWINNHPGGPGPILSLCGTDGTALFSAQHGGQARPASELKSFYIGTLQ